MRCACWVTTATNTHTEYIIFIVFSLQNSLNNCLSPFQYHRQPTTHYQQLTHRKVKHYRSRLSFWKCQFGIFPHTPIILHEFSWWFSSVSTFKRRSVTLLRPGVVPSKILSKSSSFIESTVRCYTGCFKTLGHNCRR